MSPTASLRRWAQYIEGACRKRLRRFLVYSLSALEDGGPIADAIVVRVKREDGTTYRVWVHGGRKVHHAGGFITVTDAWGNSSMFREDTVHSVVNHDSPTQTIDAETYRAKVAY